MSFCKCCQRGSALVATDKKSETSSFVCMCVGELIMLEACKVCVDFGLESEGWSGMWFGVFYLTVCV